jgi:hypothetical protein
LLGNDSDPLDRAPTRCIEEQERISRDLRYLSVLFMSRAKIEEYNYRKFSTIIDFLKHLHKSSAYDMVYCSQ